MEEDLLNYNYTDMDEYLYFIEKVIFKMKINVDKYKNSDKEGKDRLVAENIRLANKIGYSPSYTEYDIVL